MRYHHHNSTRRLRLRRKSHRPGNILVLSAVMMVMTMAFIALGLEVGAIMVARSELQRAADASALSAAWKLVDNNALSGASDLTTLKDQARTEAARYATWNKVLTRSLTLPTTDVEIGYLTNPADPNATLDLASTNPPNAVRVRTRKSSLANDPVTFAFARVFGKYSQAVEAQATAALLTHIDGFRIPGDGGNLGILPIALDEETWNAMMAGGGSDNYAWDSTNKCITHGHDGVREVNLYPEPTGSPGNRGTVDIGGNNNSTDDISRQITDGVTPADLAYHGGELKFDSSGKLYLNGDTGISAGISDELVSIMGEPRAIPIFRQVVQPGNNCTFTIVKFVGIRILNVRLTGSQSSKQVIVQPAAMTLRGAIPTTATERSTFLYSPAWLIH